MWSEVSNARDGSALLLETAVAIVALVPVQRRQR